MTARARFSTQVREDVQERVRATVRGVATATGADYTLAQFTEDALAAYCTVLEGQYHDAQPWPPREAPLRPGARFAPR